MRIGSEPRLRVGFSVRRDQGWVILALITEEALFRKAKSGSDSVFPGESIAVQLDYTCEDDGRNKVLGVPGARFTGLGKGETEGEDATRIREAW